MQDDIVHLFCMYRRPRGDGREACEITVSKYISPRPQAGAGAIRLLHAKCGGVPDVALSIYLTCIHYFLRSLGGVERVQEGKKPAERATVARAWLRRTVAMSVRQPAVGVSLGVVILDVVGVTRSTVTDY